MADRIKGGGASEYFPRVYLAVGFVLFAGLVLLPIWSYEFLPLQDYPNHLARAYIIANYDAIPALAEFYQVKFSILPNLAMDVVVPGLSQWISIHTAGKLMLSLCLLTLTSGTVALNYALFRTLNLFPLLSFLLVFNQAFLKGFVNFSFGVGLALWALALWLLSEGWNRWARLFGFSGLTVVIFFCHLYALGLYGVVVVMYELFEIVRDQHRKRLSKVLLRLSSLLQFLIPAVLYRLSPTGSNVIVEARWNSAITKLKYLWTLTDDYTLVIGLLTLGCVVFFPILGVGFKQLRFSPKMVLPLTALTLVYCFLPKELSTSANADWRLLVPLSFLWVASFQIYRYRWLTVFGVTAVAVLLSARVAVVQSVWANYQPTYQSLMACIAKMEPGQRLFTAMAHDTDRKAWPTMHFPTYAIIQKAALVPSLFAFETQQPVQFQAPYQALADATRQTVYTPRRRIPWETVLEEYDYVLLDDWAELSSTPVGQLDLIYEADQATLFQVKRLPLGHS